MKNLSGRKSLHPSAQKMMPCVLLIKLLGEYTKKREERTKYKVIISFIFISLRTKRTIQHLRIKFLSHDIICSHDDKTNFLISTLKTRKKMKKNVVSTVIYSSSGLFSLFFDINHQDTRYSKSVIRK